MAYLERTQILAADSPSIDAFSRWRVSQLQTLFDSKLLYDTGSSIWSTKIIGNATASYQQNSAGVLLQTTGSNSGVFRQSKRRLNYQPGKSQLVVFTSNFRPPVDGVIKRIGYYDANNGLYFYQSGSAFGVGIRSNTTGTPIDTMISQSNWNLDKMDGTGPSGIALNFSASHIFFLDFEWLGVGRIRYGMYQAGIPRYVHEITNVNTLNSVFMSTPNLPLRYAVINSSSASPASFLQMCSTVASEGGYDMTGANRTVDTGLTDVAVNTNLNTPLIAIRLKSTALSSTVVPIRFSAYCANAFRYALLVNPATSSNFKWTGSVDSAVEYAFGEGATAQTCSFVNEGLKLYSGFVSTAVDSINTPVDTVFALGSDIDGNQDVLVLTLVNSAGNNTAKASLTWRETI